ncbi:hypothetical protein MmTuc01_2455 [Methanosarcina mazei Tuc01]|uniref:Uncharacterized protein n=1 Tax=Methanosarcina mazei Tuc01 TaxID=1236903 RepID=M1Q5Y3_METMZ|nr:hypothetical protein MmTuc01_2455 [Methanosarcina mazei Tuc01]
MHLFWTGFSPGYGYAKLLSSSFRPCNLFSELFFKAPEYIL